MKVRWKTPLCSSDMWLFILSFIVAASLGAALRFGLSSWLSAPWGTLIVNLLGSFLMGALYIYLDRFDPYIKTIVCVAFLGALTTYSSFSLDIVRLMGQGAFKTATMYFLATNLLCIIGCYGGWQIAKTMVSKL